MAKGLKKVQKKGEGKLSMFTALLLIAMIPMVIFGLAVGVVSFVMSKKGTANLGINYMKAMANAQGIGLEGTVKHMDKKMIR